MKLYIGQQFVMPVLAAAALGKCRTDAAAILTATVLTAPADTYFLKLSVAVGDVVRLLDDEGKEAFLGSIHTLERTPEQVTLTAYDRGVYLTGNQVWGVYTGTGREIAGRLAGTLGIPLGTVEDDGVRRRIVAGAGTSAFSVLRQAVGEGREIAVRDGKLTVTDRDPIVYPLPAQDVLTVSSRASIREMVNRAVVTGRNGRTTATAENGTDSAVYGRFQRVLSSGGDDAGRAQAALKSRAMTARVTLLGNLAYRCGGTVELHRSDWGVDGVYAVTAHEHRWEAGLFTTSLSLEAIRA